MRQRSVSHGFHTTQPRARAPGREYRDVRVDACLGIEAQEFFAHDLFDFGDGSSRFARQFLDQCTVQWDVRPDSVHGQIPFLL
jgi:hypothetical protein